jgi:hypothetical protein
VGASESGQEVETLGHGDAIRVGAALLTGGGLIWLLQSSYLTYLLIFGLPLWRDVDLLPIVAGDADGVAGADIAAVSTAEELAVTRVLDGRLPRPDDARTSS